ncbi:MAG TPA: hypothetical protein VFX48_06910 [Saprospiraceae bacterium]|nr:hypothetical protein [Saprospiraceae bacterium]
MVIRNELSAEQINLLKELLKVKCGGFSFNAFMFRNENDMEMEISYPNYLIISMSEAKCNLKLSVQNVLSENYEKLLYDFSIITYQPTDVKTTLIYSFQVHEIKLYSQHIQVVDNNAELGFVDYIWDAHILLKSEVGNVLISMDNGMNGTIRMRFNQTRIEEYLEMNHKYGNRTQFNTLRMTMRYDELSGKIEIQSPGGEPSLV